MTFSLMMQHPPMLTPFFLCSMSSLFDQDGLGPLDADNICLGVTETTIIDHHNLKDK